MRLDKWLEKRRLTALTDILSFVIKVQGYGQFTDESAAHLVKFMGWRNWLSLILSGVGISKKWPRVMVLGMNNLCNRMANTLFDVRTGVHVEKSGARPFKSKAAAFRSYWKAKDRISMDADNNPMIFDKLVIALPPELPGILFSILRPKNRPCSPVLNITGSLQQWLKYRACPQAWWPAFHLIKLKRANTTAI